MELGDSIPAIMSCLTDLRVMYNQSEWIYLETH